jgi:hypothetical protein
MSDVPQYPRNPSDPQDDAQDAGGNSREISVDVPIRIAVETFPSPTERQEAREGRKEGRDRFNLIVQAVTALLVFVYATVVILQYCQLRKANQLTQDALLLNREVVRADLGAYVDADMGFAALGNTVNVGFVNHGKTNTTLTAHYEITIESLPGESPLRTVTSENITDFVPREGEPAMPNHFYEINGFDLEAYRAVKQAIRVSGTFRYDDGFGEIFSKQFCLVTSNFGTMECGDGVHRYLLSIGKAQQ